MGGTFTKKAGPCLGLVGKKAEFCRTFGSSKEHERLTKRDLQKKAWQTWKKTSSQEEIQKRVLIMYRVMPHNEDDAHMADLERTRHADQVMEKSFKPEAEILSAMVI